MAKIKKTLLPLGLAEYDVYIEDTSQNSEYFRISNLPSVFTGGRNSFLLGGSNFLKNGLKNTQLSGNPGTLFP